jgi:hypothetical protein
MPHCRLSIPCFFAVTPAIVPALAGCAGQTEYVVEPTSPTQGVAAEEGEPAAIAVVAPAPAPVVAVAPVAPVAPELLAAADALAHAAMPNGARLGEPHAGIAYARKDFTDWMFPLQLGHCYAFGFAADATVRKVQLSLFSPEHRRVDSERGLPPQGSLRHCPAENGMYRLEARAGGAGTLVVIAYADPPPGVVVMAAPVAQLPPAPALPVPLAPSASGAPGPIVVSQAGSTVNVYTR